MAVEPLAVPAPTMAATDDSLWYRDAIIYQIHVRSFFDSNGDGIGDFPGLIRKLDYVQQLGATCIWLLPFFPSPLRDDGYDIADYLSVHPSYGTLADFDEFLEAAHARGLRVMIELVINHTSDQHPWFQAARRAPRDSPQRNFYVWRDDSKGYAGTRIIFSDTETSNWAFDPDAGQYYWHRFFSHQPDLNYDNPAVFEAVLDVMRFWVDRGVDAFRLDAVPYLCEHEGTTNENLPETHAILKRLRQALDERYPNRMLLAEANQWPADVREFFGDGDECHMGFHFPLMPRMFMALKQEDRHPVTEVLRQTPEIPSTCQWAIFLRNHDELTLETVTDEERDYMYSMYAADPDMRLNLGIRRRLAPLMENSRPRIELLTSLLLSLPGTPVMYYGDEIGMGDNVYLGDRNGVRTPMQWNGDRNGGFSQVDPSRLHAPLIADAVYGYQAVNVEAQAQTPFSLLSWTRRLITLRRQHSAFGRGSIEFLHPENRKVLAYIRRDEHDTVLVVANLARTAQPVDLNLTNFVGLTPVEMTGQSEFPKITSAPYPLTLGPYGFYWFLLEAAPRSLTTRRPPAPAGSVDEPLRPLFSGNAWEKLLDGNVRLLLEQDALVPFLRRQPWVDSRGRTIRTARFAEWILITHEAHPVFLTIVEVSYAGGDAESYAVPLAALADPLGKSVADTSPAAVLTVLTGARTGIVCDAFADDEACRALARLGEREVTFTTRRGSLRLLPEAGLDTRELDASPAQVHRLGNDHRQTAIVAGKRVLKLVRRLRETPHAEVEAVRALRMTGFERVPYLLGTVEYQTASDRSLTIAVSERRVSHQGNGWDYTIDELNRFFERVSLRSDEESEADDVDRQIQSFYDLRGIPPSAAVRDSIGIYLHDIALLGTRTADLHMALASSANPAIGAEPVTQGDVRQFATSLHTRAREAFSRLEAQRKTFGPDINEKAEALLHRRAAIVDRLSRLERLSIDAQVIRCHNNYRLGQILRTEQDFVIVDFDRPVDVNVPSAAGPGFFKSVFRRFSVPPPDPRAAGGKGIALIDVATMLHSLSTATATELHAFLTTQQGDVVRIADWARRWELWTSAAFLTTYLDRAAGLPFLPADDQQVRQLLAAFLLDATLDELRHYVDRWPERVALLLQAALSLTAHLA